MLDVVLFESDRIQCARSRVAVVLRPLPLRFFGCRARKPPLQFLFRLLADRRVLKFLAALVEQPHPIFLPKLRAEPKSVLPLTESRRVIRRAAQLPVSDDACGLLIPKAWSV